MRKLLSLALVAACGGGGGDAPPTKPAAGSGAAPNAAAAAAKKKQDDKNKLQPRTHVEDKVVCDSPDKATGDTCKPESSTCEPGLYCLEVKKAGFHCEPCPERDSIRHDFHDRDFIASESERDPFQSFLIGPSVLVTNEPKPDLDKTCSKATQLVASNYSYQDLRLVGIVAQGTQRKVLMMDTADFGHIIKRGDCVGKEKAIVKDIGTGYIQFLIRSQPGDKIQKPDQEYSVPLYPKSLDVAPPPVEAPPPPPAAPAPAAPAPAPAAPAKAQ
jgi:hypothetical protein